MLKYNIFISKNRDGDVLYDSAVNPPEIREGVHFPMIEIIDADKELYNYGLFAEDKKYHLKRLEVVFEDKKNAYLYIHELYLDYLQNQTAESLNRLKRKVKHGTLACFVMEEEIYMFSKWHRSYVVYYEYLTEYKYGKVPEPLYEDGPRFKVDTFDKLIELFLDIHNKNKKRADFTHLQSEKYRGLIHTDMTWSEYYTEKGIRVDLFIDKERARVMDESRKGKDPFFDFAEALDPILCIKYKGYELTVSCDYNVVATLYVYPYGDFYDVGYSKMKNPYLIRDKSSDCSKFDFPYAYDDFMETVEEYANILIEYVHRKE